MKLPSLTCGSCVQCTDGVLTGAQPATIATWNRAKKILGYRRGQVLFREGTPSRGLYAIYSGRIKLYRTTSAGEVQIVRLAGPSDIIGHRSLLAGEPLACTAEALEEAVVCMVEREIVLQSIREDPAVAMSFLTQMARSLGRAEERLLALAHRSTCARVAGFLLEQCDAQGRVALRLTREEIGQVLGTTTESVSRVLRFLAQRNLLRLEGRGLRLLAPQALAYLASDPPEAGLVTGPRGGTVQIPLSVQGGGPGPDRSGAAPPPGAGRLARDREAPRHEGPSLAAGPAGLP